MADGVVVMEGMLTEAARVRDLKSLTLWARQNVRVTTAEPLVVAVQGRHLDAMRCLVQELGADVNGGMPTKDTPLAIAAVHDYLAGVQCLVELGADVNQASVGKMPLSIAASMGNIGIVRSLVQLGARLEAVDRDGDTALLVGVCNGHYPTV
jgi:ankyrin repeat protein